MDRSVVRARRALPLLAACTAILALTACGVGEEVGASAAASATALPSASPSPPEPSASGTPTVEPTASEQAGPVEPPELAWDEPQAFDGQPNAIYVDGGTWVIGGWASEDGPAAWTSSDARTWSSAQVPDPQPHDLFRGSGLGPMIRVGDSLLSYGTFVGCCDGRGVLGWRLPDGADWEVIESSSPLFEQGYLVIGLAVGEPALVAIEQQYSDLAGRIWRWTEDTSWVDVTPLTDTAEDFSTGLAVSDVVWSEDRFVVVGVIGDPPGDGSAGAGTGASWVSTDGETWQTSPHQDELANIRLTHVVPMPDGGYVALGQSDVANFGREGTPVAFTSTDGLEWTPVDAPPAPAPSRPVGLHVVDGGYVALTSPGTGITAWTSADGNAWVNAATLDHEFLASATDGDTVLVATADYSDSPLSVVLHRATVQP